jgi:hypothetical protein
MNATDAPLLLLDLFIKTSQNIPIDLQDPKDNLPLHAGDQLIVTE